MFFSGPKVLLLIKRHSLEIYYIKSERVMEIPFHSSAVRHLEVVSSDEVTKTLIEAFKSANLAKQNAIIALSDQIVFEKLVPQDSKDPQREISDFFHNVPLEEEHIAKKVMPLKGAVLALAANRELFKLVQEVAFEFDWKIKAVIPMTPFAKLSEDSRLPPEQVEQILNADDIFKEADFLNETVLIGEGVKDKNILEDDEKRNGSVEPGDDGGEKPKANPLLTVIIAVFCISLIIGALFFFKIISLPFSLPWTGSEIIPEASIVPQASESAPLSESTSSGNIQEATVEAQLNRADVRIHVLNGSSIAGQAAVIKEKLAEIGYENVITGNIESSEASASSIIYSENLEGQIKNEISGLMDSLIEGIMKTEEVISEFSAVITLGKLDQAIR